MSSNEIGNKSKLAEMVENHFRVFSSKVPRRSNQEHVAAEFVRDFAENLGLDVFYKPSVVDGRNINNVYVKKPATKDREGSDPIILQAHLDMVCEPNNCSYHNFDREAIVIQDEYIEGIRWLKADRTTLGADDGIGVACIMAILEAGPDEVSHPPIEAIFTSDEEAEMSGAANIDAALLKSKRMINIDTEQEGMFFYGCAGGLNLKVNVPLVTEVPSQRPKYYFLTIAGLMGGHSGLMIDKHRANANRLMGRLLDTLSNDEGIGKLYLHSIDGGDYPNAIPVKCEALIAIDGGHEDALENVVKNMRDTFLEEYKGTETGEETLDDGTKRPTGKKLEITLTPTEPDSIEPLEAMTQNTLNNLITVMTTVPNDVIAMHTEIEDLVETSCNMGIVEKSEDGKNIEVVCFARSCFESKKDMVARQIMRIASSVDAEVNKSSDFPAWQPNEDSRLKRVLEQTYKKLFPDRDAAVTKSIHAGLECGHFIKAIDRIDCIAIGPTITGAHTTEEKLRYDTIEDIIALLVGVLADIDDSKFDKVEKSVISSDRASVNETHFNCACMR